MAKQIEIYDVGKARVIEIPDPPPPEKDEVVVETLYSGISSGTEMAFFQGFAPHLRKKFDPQSKLFVKTDDDSLKYPCCCGYENVGRVVSAGKNVNSLKPGDIVFCYYGHQSRFKTDAASLALWPQKIDPRGGIFMPLLGVAYKNILNARIILGETVAVFGMGVVGQLILQLAKMSGAGMMIAIDMLDTRLDIARDSGADVILNPKSIDDIALKVRHLTDFRGADVVFESTGTTQALQEAVRTVYPSGPVFATSFYKGEAKGLFLGEEFHHLKSSIVSSGGIPNDVRPRWDEKRWQNTINELTPTLKLSQLISHEFSIADAQEAYDLIANEPQKTMQVIFKY